MNPSEKVSSALPEIAPRLDASRKPAAWQEGRCNRPMWMGGCPAGTCDEIAYGHQLPDRYLYETRCWSEAPYCHGHACVNHGGPTKDEPRIFQDGTTEQGRVMWCAVMPDFINLQESPAGFDGDPLVAVANLRTALAKAGAA